MATYTTFSGKSDRTIHHRFTCGKCGKTTGWIQTVIPVETAVETRHLVSRSADHDYMQEQLRLALDREMNNIAALITKNAKKGYYFGEGVLRTPLDSTCPYCRCKNRGKDDVWMSTFMGGFGGLVVGMIVALVWAFFGELYSMWPLVSVVVFTILIGCVLGYFSGKKKAKKSAVHTHVEYSWDGIPSVKPVEPPCLHDWSCGVCRICGATDEDRGHDFVDGKCTVCGFDPVQEKLVKVAKNGATRQDRIDAIRKLTDQSVLADIVQANNNYDDRYVAMAAVEMLEDRRKLCFVAESTAYGISEKAIEKLTDPAKTNCENHHFESHSSTTKAGRDCEMTLSWEECTLCGLWRNPDKSWRFTDY